MCAEYSGGRYRRPVGEAHARRADDVRLRYTPGMSTGQTERHAKLAISLPDDVFARLRDYAAEHDLPRSVVVARALATYFEKLDAADFTRQMNDAWSELSEAEIEEEMGPLRVTGREMHRRLAALETEPWETN